MGLEQQVEALTKKLREQEDQIKRLKSGKDDLRNTADGLAGAIDNLTAIGAKGTTQVRDSADAYGALVKAYESTGNVFGQLAMKVGAATSQFGTFGKAVGGVLAAAGGITSAFVSLGGTIANVPKDVIESLDGFTRGMRSFEAGMFDMEKRFGGSIDQAKQFSDNMRLAAGNPLAKSLRMTTNEMAELVKATRNSSLTQKQLSQVVQTGAGAIELYGAATAFAASTGMDLRDGATLLNDLLNKQGKSAQEATNMMGLYIGVAEESGLSIDTVAGSLNSAVEQFKKIGMAADFGAPILKGFTKTVDEMGLGIENAVGLSQSLTASLASLTNNYAMAYLTFQRGGLDIGGGGGGGVLGSSIALQAAYLDAEKTGDQSEISNQLVRGMRDTLSSFTGGDIVTVQQAAEDSSLQNQFYVQQQMLKNNFGIGDDNTASRVLEMLSQLDEATRTGDEDAQKKLAEQIQKETQGRDKTLDEMTKMNRELQIQTNLLTVQTRAALDQTRRAAAGARRGIQPMADGAARLAEQAINSAGSALESAMAGKVRPLEDPVVNAALNNQNFGSSGLPTRIDQATANMFASRTAMGPNGDLSDTTYKNTLEGFLGRDLDRSGSKVLGSEIQSLASVIANQAAPGDLQGGPGGGRAGLERQFAAELKQALESLNIQIDMSPRAAGNLDAAASVNNQVAAIANGRPTR